MTASNQILGGGGGGGGRAGEGQVSLVLVPEGRVGEGGGFLFMISKSDGD